MISVSVTRSVAVMASAVVGTSAATFRAPGNEWYSPGRGPAGYRVTAWPSGRTTEVAATAAAGSRESVQVPRGTWRLTVQPVGSTGRRGLPVTR